MTDLSAELSSASEKVNRFLNEAIATGKPEELYEASRHIVSAGGKRLRPFIVLESCKLVGGDPENAVPIAAAVELVHNFTLVHDDIMDQDEKRRGVPTVHVQYGVPMAINAGDLLFAKAYQATLKSMSRGISPKRTLQALETLTEAILRICEGQAMDMAFVKQGTVEEDEYIEMIGLKTAALLEASAIVGATVGGGSNREIRRLGRAMMATGIAFQLVDDVLGLTADEAALGKPVGSDIREGKKTLIVAHGLRHMGKRQKEILLRGLGNKAAEPGTVEAAMNALRSSGSINYVVRKADLFARKAKRELEGFPASETRSLLLALVDYVVARDR